MNLNLDQKPNLKSKGKRLGVKTGNTVKYNKYSHAETTKPTTFTTKSFDSVCSPGTPQITVTYSLNKNKAWEILDDLKADPDYIVEETVSINPGRNHYHSQKTVAEKYKKKQTEEASETSETNLELVAGRKGITIKKQRNPGKKGVKKSGGSDKIETEAKVVIEVEKTAPKDSGMVYQQNFTNHLGYGYWDGNKNVKHKKRQQNVKDCQL